MHYDYLIVGAGIAGITAAERLCSGGKKCLMVDTRNHIGGNCYDRIDDAGVLVHQYGPHYFRTNSTRIFDYLSRFTSWRKVDYTIKVWAHGRYWSFPINLNTFEELQGRAATEKEFESWLEKERVPIANVANSEDAVTSKVGRRLYELFFEGYTLKQWKKHPRELDASVCGRIPMRMGRDNRYLVDCYQAMPAAGYTAMFRRMIDSCGARLTLCLNTDYRNLPNTTWDRMVYTGPIDSFYGHRFGELPYRSLRFEHKSFSKYQLDILRHDGIIHGPSGFFQPAVQINYTDASIPYTRTVEIKHVTGQVTDSTTVVTEYPEDYGPGRDPFYPVPTRESAALYAKYKALADSEPKVDFIGRLATYRYYNMDQVVGMALTLTDKRLV